MNIENICRDGRFILEYLGVPNSGSHKSFLSADGFWQTEMECISYVRFVEQGVRLPVKESNCLTKENINKTRTVNVR